VVTVALTRRRAIRLGGLGVAGIVVGGAGLAWQRAGADPGPGSASGTASEGTFTEPMALVSTDGALDLTLEVTAVGGPIAGRHATTLRYNGSLPGPTLRLVPGDHLTITLVNRLAEPTSLHTHGLAVSPRGAGDNPFVMVDPGGSHRYEYRIPDDHPTGTCWYHPHHHGLVADQVFAGLYGAIVIADPPSAAPAVTADRVLIVSDITLSAGGVAPATAMQRMNGREGELVLVNGQLRPTLTARPGTRERWRIVNACASRYLRLRLDGQEMALIGIDLPLGGAPRQVDELLLTPGNRADLLVTTRPGAATLRAMPYDRGGAMGRMGGRLADDSTVDLAQLTVAGTAAPPLPPIPRAAAADDLRAGQVTRRRELTLAMGAGMGMGGGPGTPGGAFTIDGRSYDPDRVDLAIEPGQEDWTITNTSPMDHPFHLHVWPMQVLSIAGLATDEPTWRNVVNVPARSSTVVRIAFDGITGRTVYHCHILDHEDGGMMGVIDVG
jgi:FtsP/CotA-like multicopper oxidase with cupredoxin domain